MAVHDGDDLLSWLQDWYAGQCNGEWEHQYGVRIDSLDNPGWWVKIDLVGTALAGQPFTPEVWRDGADWLDCQVREDVFEGAGSPAMLRAILTRFRAWCEVSE